MLSIRAPQNSQEAHSDQMKGAAVRDIPVAVVADERRTETTNNTTWKSIDQSQTCHRVWLREERAVHAVVIG